jgi:GTP-dependent phosphoenolpyruvate carboxykinase
MEAWVAEAAQLTKPEKIVFCDGSESENKQIIGEMLAQ